MFKTDPDISGVYEENYDVECTGCESVIPAGDGIMYIDDEGDLLSPSRYVENEYPLCLECATYVFVAVEFEEAEC